MGPSDEIDLPGWERIVDYIAVHFLFLPVITITGGEPLMLDWLEDLGTYIRDKGIRWGFVTNGLLLDAQKLRELESASIESITISLDGSEETHDTIRGKAGVWRSVMHAISLLGRSGVPVKDVVTCVSPKTLGDLDATASVLLNAGITSWRLFRIFPKGRALAHPELFLSRVEYASLLEWIRSKRPLFAKAGLELSLSCDGWLPYDLDRMVRSTPFFCRSGIQIASILHDGTITGCPNNDPEYSQGNFFDDDFLSVWNNGFETFRNRAWVKSTASSSCDALAGCEGGSIHSWVPGRKAPLQCWKIDAQTQPCIAN